MKFADIVGTVGRTPVVRLNRLAPPGVNVYVKIEAFNPTGSVKDRLAVGAIEDAERTGRLRPGQTVIEATSGNTGIGLAMVCAAKGYPLVVTMAENFSVERRKLMRFFGARVVLTPAALKGTGMLAKAIELAQEHGWFLVSQFDNEANAATHSATTAVEILDDFAGERLDAWVTGYGTGGTLKGVARVLRRARPETRIVVCEPDNSPVLGSGLPQPRLENGAPAGSHPAFRPHLMQGWSPDFIPDLAAHAIEAGYIDRVLPINGNDAMRVAHELASREGILAGISAGATLAGALKLAEELPAGANVVAMLPDTGERYLSTPLFADIAVDMTPEEWSISRSTPGARFDASSTPAPAQAPAAPSRVAAPPAPGNPEAESFVEAAIHDAKAPVVMFALEWCEFCWSVRRMFEHFGIGHRVVALDSAEYQAADLGGRIRASVSARTGQQTIPQIFIGGHFIGGCTDLFDGWRAGSVQEKLASAGVAVRDVPAVDPATFLPKWLQARDSAA